MAVVTFNPADFRGAFGEFSNCSDAQCSGWFARATLIFENNSCNPAFADGNMAMLYNLLVAHIGWLNAPRDASGNPAQTGEPPAPIVGRINSATEGSVSLGADMGDSAAGSPSQPWFMQTRYGAEFWASTVQYRSGGFVPGPFRNFQPVYPFWPGRRY